MVQRFFLIDFSRELIAIALLPNVGRFILVSMIGYRGGTAMDFSLPIIKQNLIALMKEEDQRSLH